MGRIGSSQPSSASPDTRPEDLGYLEWAGDPLRFGTGTIGSGNVCVWQIRLRQPRTVTNVHSGITAAGASLTDASCLMGVYDATGNKLRETGGLKAAWETVASAAHLKTHALTSPVDVSGAYIYVALLMVHASTSPTFLRYSGSGGQNYLAQGLANAKRVGIAATGQTALPASISPTGIDPNVAAPWCAIS